MILAMQPRITCILSPARKCRRERRSRSSELTVQHKSISDLTLNVRSSKGSSSCLNITASVCPKLYAALGGARVHHLVCTSTHASPFLTCHMRFVTKSTMMLLLPPGQSRFGQAHGIYPIVKLWAEKSRPRRIQ